MRNLKLFSVLALVAIAQSAWATTPVLKDIDSINATGGSTLTVPVTGTTFASDSNSLTLTNKTISAGTYSGGGSFAGTFTGTPTFSGALSLTGGPSLSGSGTITSAFHLIDTSDSTKQLAFSLSGNTTGKTITFSFSQTNSATLSVPNIAGGGDTMATLGATQTFGAGSTWNGQVIGAAYGGASTTVNNSVASPQSVTASGGVTLSTPTFANITFIKANTSGTTVVTATPSITACTVAGQTLYVVSASSTNLVTLQNNADLSGSQLLLNGPWTSGFNNGTPYVLNLLCDGAGTPHWVEMSRNN